MSTGAVHTLEHRGAAPSALLTLAMIREEYLPLGERTVFRLISSGKFPRPDVAIGAKIRLWRRETVERWVATQSAASEHHAR